jgi:hypothetical protein
LTLVGIHIQNQISVVFPQLPVATTVSPTRVSPTVQLIAIGPPVMPVPLHDIAPDAVPDAAVSVPLPLKAMLQLPTAVPNVPDAVPVNEMVLLVVVVAEALTPGDIVPVPTIGPVTAASAGTTEVKSVDSAVRIVTVSNNKLFFTSFLPKSLN